MPDDVLSRRLSPAPESMRVLQVGRGDLLGGRFNGYALRGLLKERGISPRYLAYDRRSDDPLVGRALDWWGRDVLVRRAAALERRWSLHSLLQLHSFGLPLQQAFREADVVHYHVIHDGFFSILALPALARRRPSVWTWHDPWIMTGHCIYPMECQGWRTGCGGCPDLQRPFAMREDRTALNFRIKQKVVGRTRADIVVASRWMAEMLAASPIGQQVRPHVIPFGIDLSMFRPGRTAEARARLGIPPGNVVLALRGQDSPFKGVKELVQALERIETRAPLSIVVIQDSGRFDHLLARHHVIPLPWFDGEQALSDALAAADIFAMPSNAEAFGMMAIEAMATGCALVVFDGTSLPDVVRAPDVGVAVPMGDVAALAAALARLVDDPAERAARGAAGRRLAEAEYGEALFADRMAALYREVAARHAVQERVAA